MKPSTLLMGLCATQALAMPGMESAMAEIQARDDFFLEARSTDLLGDLIGGVLTAVGNIIKAILQGSSAVGDGATYTAPGSLGSDACKNDALCAWSYIVKDMSTAFVGAVGCTDAARGAIRQGFHDASTWDKNSPYGGADGSLLLSDELTRPENRGLGAIGDQTKAWYNTYNQYGLSMADIIQTAAKVAVVSCPGGPRIRAFAGRRDDSRAGPTDMLPSPFQDAQSLIDLFVAKTFSAADLIALLGAHSTSKQNFVDPSRAGTPQDSDPGVWDTRFYSETLTSDNTTILVFPSDRNLATFSQTRAQWNSFAGAGGQIRWAPAFASAYFRMSMLGVDNMNQLTEITRVIPLPR
ncbi:Uu.00g131750.m01.CDS01 [Anthostomella pinea]|uniref:Peroxidase n=1 Tax=Anthostomella pinea TaxID=933095 RepID=A0AAI8VJJ1_9PEZI|nr:Uu.00g131750.m01.CDS01 [Anthostomella pinea]